MQVAYIIFGMETAPPSPPTNIHIIHTFNFYAWGSRLTVQNVKIFIWFISDDDSSGIGSWNEIYGFIYYTCISNNRCIFFYIQQWFCKKYCVSQNKSTDVSSISDKIPSQRNLFMRLAFFANIISYFLNWEKILLVKFFYNWDPKWKKC